MSEMNRREVLQGFGLFGVGLLFRSSKGPELVSAPELPDQLPVACDVVAVPQRPFRTRRLVVPPDLGPHFVIENITVGARSQMIEGEPIPAEVFSPEWQMMGVEFDPTSPGMEIRFRVRNISKEPRRFIAMLVGEGLDHNGRPRQMVLPIDSVALIEGTPAPASMKPRSFWARLFGLA